MFLSCIIHPLSSQLFDAHTVVALLYIKEIVLAPVLIWSFLNVVVENSRVTHTNEE